MLQSYFTHIHPHPRPYTLQRNSYSRTHKRVDKLNDNYEPEERGSRTTYFIKRTQKKQEENGNENEFDYDNQGNYFSYVVERPRRIVTTRSVSHGRNDGRFAFNLGLSQPINIRTIGLNNPTRSMANRVENRRIVRTTKTERISSDNNPRVIKQTTYVVRYNTGS